MKSTILPDHTPSNSNSTTREDITSQTKKAFNRRSFLKNSVVAGAVGEDLQSNLIMPEPTAFLNKQKLPVCSIIRPTAAKNAATVALQGFINMNVFVNQSQAFFNFVTQLAQEADNAKRGTS